MTSPGQPPTIARYQWFSDINAALPGLPRNFGPYDASAVVNTGPTRIFQAIETIQSFPNSADAASFLRMFEQPAAQAEFIVNSKIRHVGFEMRKIGGLGSQAIAITSQAHSAGFPVDVQYVVRTGSVVTTLQPIGGREVTASRELALARQAQAHMLRTCPALSRQV